MAEVQNGFEKESIFNKIPCVGFQFPKAAQLPTSLIVWLGCVKALNLNFTNPLKSIYCS